MKSISLFTVSLFCLLQSFAINKPVRDTVPNNIKNYSKEQFLKEFGKDEISEKMIRFYFYERKRSKGRMNVFTSLTVATAVFGVLLISGPVSGYGFLLALGAFAFSIAFFCSFLEASDNRRKYSPESLYKKLMDYQAGKPLSKRLKRQLKYFNKN